jgi:aminocarboxymuconate-semialdehyde decarboxylase
VVARLWHDTVGHGHLPALRAAYETFGAGRLVLGSDYPYQQNEEYRNAVSYVLAAGIPASEANAILGSTAEKLIGRQVI